MCASDVAPVCFCYTRVHTAAAINAPEIVYLDMPEEPTKAKAPEDKKECIECHEPFQGRSDKKFCSPACKDNYYNKLKAQTKKEIGIIDSALKRNRKILKQLFDPEQENRLITRRKLLRAGFNFEFHTHHLTTSIHANEFIFCYDYGYREVVKDKYKIIKSFE